MFEKCLVALDRLNRFKNMLCPRDAVTLRFE